MPLALSYAPRSRRRLGEAVAPAALAAIVPGSWAVAAMASRFYGTREPYFDGGDVLTLWCIAGFAALLSLGLLWVLCFGAFSGPRYSVALMLVITVAVMAPPLSVCFLCASQAQTQLNLARNWQAQAAPGPRI